MSLRRSIAWTFVAQGLYFVIQYGGSIILARLLSPKEMGVYTIALTTIALLTMLQSLGLNTFILREQNLTREKFGTAVCINAILNVVIAALVLATAPLVSVTADWSVGICAVSAAISLSLRATASLAAVSAA